MFFLSKIFHWSKSFYPLNLGYVIHILIIISWLLLLSVWPLDSYVPHALLHQAGNGYPCWRNFENFLRCWFILFPILKFGWTAAIYNSPILCSCYQFMIHLTLWSAYDGDIFTSENAIAIWIELCVISFNNLGWKMTSQAAPLELDTSTVLLLNISGEEWWPAVFYVWIADLEYFDLICCQIVNFGCWVCFCSSKRVCYVVILLI